MTENERIALKNRIIGILKLYGEFPIEYLADLIIAELKP